MDIEIPSIDGTVPEYEEREAAAFVHISWPAWLRMNWYDRAAAVSQYRIHYLIEAHSQDAQRRASERARRRKK